MGAIWYYFDKNQKSIKKCYNLIKNEKGSVAMARNKSIQSAKCQFFINAKHNKNLDGKYTVFAIYQIGRKVAVFTILSFFYKEAFVAIVTSYTFIT